MIPIESILRQRFSTALGLAFGAEFADQPMIKAGDEKFADYQCNAAMALGKQLGLAPRAVAEKIIAHLEISDLCSVPQVAGPGFINLRLKPEWVAHRLAELFSDSVEKNRGGVDLVAQPQTVVVDYAGPNIAKEMHVGHLRSAILGDAISRTLKFLGHTVVRQNHVGDFGTQFGMLIRHAQDLKLRTDDGTASGPQIADLDTYYKEAALRDKTNPDFARQARQAVVALQHQDPQTTALWHWIVDESRRHAGELFTMLGVQLTDADERGESFYRDRLAPVVERLKSAFAYGGDGPATGLVEVFTSDSHPRGPVDFTGVPPRDAAEALGALAAAEGMERAMEASSTAPVTRAFVAESQGATCVFLPGFVDKDKAPLPLIIQKSDGAYLYATTDLAALYFRIIENKDTPEDRRPLAQDWHADQVIYVTDARQSQHFAMVFDTLRAARWDIHPQSHQHVQLDHAAFGSILGEDGKPFKTRSGESVKLRDLLTEAVSRASAVMLEKNPELSPQVHAAASRTVGIGAVKYADLKQDRTTDYAFSWARMLALEGNTGPYLQYCYTRICSIFRKAGQTPADVVLHGELKLNAPQEMALGRKLLQFPAAVEAVERELKPHHLCNYLYSLCCAFSAFYEACPVVKAADPELRTSRLILCELTAAILRLGLHDLLGIGVLEEM
ncbi:MAG: arginine--tRNA ligase [Phycisphaerae bacterium]|nr:arginine--tRNA ligase [Phycisphaerae bacterium]